MRMLEIIERKRDGGELTSEQIELFKEGYISGIDAGEIGWSCVRLGSGREVKGEPIDYSLGLIISVKLGDQVSANDVLEGNVQAKLVGAKRKLPQAILWSEEPVNSLPTFMRRLSE